MVRKLKKQVKDNFLAAEKEALGYNWTKAIEYLEKTKSICVENNFDEDKYYLFFKLGQLYYILADCEESEELVLQNFEASNKNFQEAIGTAENLKLMANLEIARGYLNLLDYIVKSKGIKQKTVLQTAKDNFNKAREFYVEEGNEVESLKMNVLVCRTLELLIGEKLTRLDSYKDFKDQLNEFNKLMTELRDKLKENIKLPEIYIYHALISLQELFIWVIAYAPADLLDIREFVIENLSIVQEFIDLLENSSKILALFTAHTIHAFMSMNFGVYYQTNQFEQLKYLRQAQKWLNKGEELLPKIKLNISKGIFYYAKFNVAIRLVTIGYYDKNFQDILEDLNLCIVSISRYFPKILVGHILFYTAGIFLIGAFTIPASKKQRLDLVKQAQSLIERVTTTISLDKYKLYNLVAIYSTCAVNSLLGALSVNVKEREIYLQKAAEVYTNLSKFIDPKIKTTQVFYQCVVAASRIGALLARYSTETPEKIIYLQKTLELLLTLSTSESVAEPYYRIPNLFEIGQAYYEMGILTNDSKDFNNASKYFNQAIEYCKDKGYFSLICSAFVNLARIEDHLGNFLSASENYKKALEAVDEAIQIYTYSILSKRIEKLKDYLKAWELIETAKSLHVNEDHQKAQLEYEKACQILETIRAYSFEAPFYASWALLEKAESLSKLNEHEKAAQCYLDAKDSFLNASVSLKENLTKKKSRDERNRLNNLLKAAELRETYCNARNQIEIARIESKKGKHQIAAELYKKSSLLFEKLCSLFKIPREKDELKAIYFFCRAWESMERAEQETNAILYETASDLFEKASDIFQEVRMKKLSLGNALFCSALQCGTLFDKAATLTEKIDFYKKIKMALRESSKNYQLGGFQQDAQWALATSTFFDGIWQLIQADNAIEVSKKNQFLTAAKNYLNTALEIFETAGYKKKREEIVIFLKMIEEEKAILASALNVIEKPEISASSIGISAPSCPIEISSPVNIEEMRKQDLKAESEMNWDKQIHHLSLFMSNGICIYDYSFKKEAVIDSQLFSTGLAGISMLIQELTKSNTKVKIVEQEEVTILLEHGTYLSAALIADENLITLRNKLTQLIEEVEEFYKEELEEFHGELGIFSKIGKFIPKIFPLATT